MRVENYDYNRLSRIPYNSSLLPYRAKFLTLGKAHANMALLSLNRNFHFLFFTFPSSLLYYSCDSGPEGVEAALYVLVSAVYLGYVAYFRCPFGRHGGYEQRYAGAYVGA